MRSWTRNVAAAACAGALLATAACGSTVAVGGTASVGGQGDLGQGQQGVPQSGSADGQVIPGQSGTAPTPITGGTSAAAAPDGGSTSAGTSGGGTSGGTSGGLGAIAHGAKKPIVIGVVTSGNATGFANSVGLHLNFGDQRVQAKLVADYLNAHGGVAGHKIGLTFYDYDASGSATSNAQAACSAFTEDQKAFASIGVAGLADNFHACAAKKGMFVLADGDLKSESFFTKYPTTILISDLALARKYRGMVLGLKSMGFFTPGAKVGILSGDENNDIEGIRQGMKPALASLGIKVSQEISINTSDSGQYASQESAAVLKFRAEGITHILFGFASAYVFAEAAQTQSYFPKMGVESRQSPALLMQGTNSNDELVNVMGIGYQPLQDVDAAHDPGPVSDNQRLCAKIYKDGGQSSTSRLAVAAGLYLCDQLLFLKQSLAGAPDLSRASFLDGVAGIGSTYRSPLTFSTHFAANQHDGAGSYRELRFDKGCSCFVYGKALHLFP